MKNSFFIFFWKLHWNQYKKDSFIVFSSWFITFFTVIVWLLLREINYSEIKIDSYILASGIGISVIRNSLYNFSKFLYEIKNTTVFKRFIYAPYSNILIIIWLVLFNQIINLLVAIFLFSIGMLFPEQREIVENINWIMVISGFLLLAILSNLMALIFVMMISSEEKTLLICNIYYYGGMYILGLVIPYTEISEIKFLVIISYFFPQKYALTILESGWINRTDFTMVDVNGNLLDKNFGYGKHSWIPYFMSILLIILISTLIFSYLKIKERKVKKYAK